MLSSVSGVVGQKRRVNYAGGNIFEDAIASYRCALGLPAISINLGPIEDVGVIEGNDDSLSRFKTGTWSGINEGLLRRIFDYSLLQQHPDLQCRLNLTSCAQMITGLAFPQPEDSQLLQDVRFDGFRVAKNGTGLSTPSSEQAGEGRELQAFFLLAQSADPSMPALLSAATTVVGAKLAEQLRKTEEIDPARPLSQYGMDSLAAVEFRNWMRASLGVELTTLDVVNATSLVALCGKPISKRGLST